MVAESLLKMVCELMQFVSIKFGVLISWDNSYELVNTPNVEPFPYLWSRLSLDPPFPLGEVDSNLIELC